MGPLQVYLSLIGFFCIGLAGAAEPSLDLPADQFPGGKPGAMMNRYWLNQAEQATQRWQTEYEGRKNPAQIAAYQKLMRRIFLEAIGDLPERTPLNPKITGTVNRDGYRVEKIIFESQPRHFVTALLFLPQASRFPPPFPGVLVPCGHSQNGKGYESYQSMGALLALNGMAALVFDPIDQGERGQYLGQEGWPKLWGTGAHSLVGKGSALLGRNTARFEIWDGVRAIDYLQSRPEVDPQRIGCTGNSGGGTQTSYLMALDDRIRAAAPSCYLCGFPALLKTIGPQDAEQNIFGQLAFGMDHADYLMMRAPTPILVCAATKDFFDIKGTWEMFRYAKRLYSRMGFAERVAILENDAEHNYNKLQREAVVRWMARWLRGKDEPITEPPIQLLSAQEYQCTPKGQVMLLSGARSTYDLNEEYENQLAPRRAALWKTGNRASLMARVQQLAAIRPLDKLPRPVVMKVETVARPGYRMEKLLLQPEEGLVLPALLFLPEQGKSKQAIIFVHDQGKALVLGLEGGIERLIREGSTVLAVDLCGTGQTKPASTEGADVFMAYLLGRSYVGLRAEDILMAARHLQDRNDGKPVGLYSIGQVGIPALHAAALHPALFQSVRLQGKRHSWSEAIHQPLKPIPYDQVVHGALTTYDLPDLVSALGSKMVDKQ
jgi:dienelactone hydrolase